MEKEDAKAIKNNLISNVIWQGFLVLPTTFSITKGLIKRFFEATNMLKIDNTVAFIALAVFIETIFVFLLFLINKFINKNEKKIKPQDSENRPEECEIVEDVGEEIQDDFYFENYTKHVTIYPDGNGIIMNSFDICINNVENFKEFKRKINVEDGKKDVEFPTLSKMKDTPKGRRFDEFGFWVYKPKESIINSTIERYWLDSDPDEIDHSAEHNKKELRWVFEINRSKSKKQKIHKIAYAISVPGLYPIEKGRFNRDVANEPESEGKALSSIHVEHYAKKITYIVSFENSINLKCEPECFTVNGKKYPITDFIVEEGVFYNKYIFTICKPPYGTNIVIKWEFYGGDNLDKEGGYNMDKEGGD